MEFEDFDLIDINDISSFILYSSSLLRYFATLSKSSEDSEVKISLI